MPRYKSIKQVVGDNLYYVFYKYVSNTNQILFETSSNKFDTNSINLINQSNTTVLFWLQITIPCIQGPLLQLARL